MLNIAADGMKTYARALVCALLQVTLCNAPASAARTGSESIGVIGTVSDTGSDIQRPVVAGASWWIGFEEEPLNRFMRLARTSASPRGEQETFEPAQLADAVSLYLTLRVQQLRLAVIEQHKMALHAERQAIAQRPPRKELASWLAEADRRRVALDATKQALELERLSTARWMLQLAGNTEDARELIERAASASGIPRFMRNVPSRLPASVLASRPEVAFAARTSTQRSALPELLSGWVERAQSPAPLLLEPLNDQRPLHTVLSQAAHDVGWSLRLVAHSGNQVQLQSRRLDAAKLELEASKARASVGDTDTSAVPRALQNVLVEADALIVDYGRLALAWVDLHRKAPSTWTHLSSESPTE